ncbi:hypothetical protein [Microbacterium oleivorans]|uniref:Uncharacterized protein n=1 Tax=Microbacterium oleivorans TaxID=273677 RepID=A0A177K6P6_9MICO|nr:hypothetical protein [Microbacterium oleivorans]OAH49060.1 hypothetical protein AYL44_13725 [Microbacterium oleivorans]
MSAVGRAVKDSLDALRRGADDLHVRLDTGVTRKIDTHLTLTNSDVEVLDGNTVDLDAPTVPRVPVIRDQVNASADGLHRPGTSGPQVRRYDGLIQNVDGTWTGIEVKSGSATRNPAQLLFDTTVGPDTPAIAKLHGSEIRIVRVLLQEVP